MAQVAFGFGSSHGPIFNPPEAWLRLAQQDQRDSRLDYPELLRTARPGLEAETTPEKMRVRYEAVQAASQALAEQVKTANPDVIVVLSNPHGSIPYEQMQPVFGIYLGASREPTSTLPRPRFAGEPSADSADGFPTDSELADHLMQSLIDDGIDVACSFQPQLGTGAVRDHAYSVLYDKYVPDRSIPMVPFVISRYSPNLATPKRCYALGQAIRRAVESWNRDKKVAIMASGGLSHQILDEELDHIVIDGLQEGDTDRLYSLPRPRLDRGGGTPEILNWVAAAGAMEPTRMTLIDYVPCYRSLAGTGHGMTFGYWE